MVLGKITDAFEKREREEPARTVDVFRTFASLSPDASTTSFYGAVRVIRNSFASNAKEAFSYPEMVAFSRGIAARSTHVGWVWFAGTITIDSERRELFFPAVSMPAEVVSLYPIPLLGLTVTNDPRLFSLLRDREELHDLSERLNSEMGWDDIRFTRAGRLTNPSKWVDPEVLHPWIHDYAKAGGFEVSEIRSDDPRDHVEKEGITAHIGTCLVNNGNRYVSAQAFDLTDLGRLRGVGGTAFNALYGQGVDLDSKKIDHLSPTLINNRPESHRERLASHRQSEALLAFRPLSQRQRTVAERLVGARLGALSGAPGTGKTHIISVVAADAIARGESVLVVAGSPHAVDALVDHFFETPGPPPMTFGGAQHDNRLAEELEKVSELIGKKTKIAPEKLKAAASHDESANELRSALARLDEPDSSDGEAVRPDIDHLLDQLVAGEAEAAEVAGEVLTNHWISGLNRNTKKTFRQVAEISQLAPMERRKQFASLNPNYLIKVLPLWVGSVDSLDDVLPTYLEMFDLVIIDEAAQIDQVRAANSLVRARRALVCGDPAQIGIDNAPTDEELRSAKVKHGTTRNDFDVQNRSIFDVAASQVPVEALDEHFRSVPHLIEFSSRRFYDGVLHTATRNPANEAADHIDLHVVEGERDQDGVNAQEIEACMAVLDRYINSGGRNIGVVTPFEPQAAALQAAVQQRYSEAEVSDLSILVGTVNELQGHERDQMVISLCVGTHESEGAWKVVNDERFFNVMVTRARHHATVITSSANPPGLAGEYVKWTEPLVDLLRDEPVADPWVLRVGERLRADGIAVRTGYRVGRYLVDVVAGEGENAVAIDCALHADGVDAHIDRGLMLRRTGWRTTDAFEEKWQYLLDDYPSDLREKFPDLGGTTSGP